MGKTRKLYSSIIDGTPSNYEWEKEHILTANLLKAGGDAVKLGGKIATGFVKALYAAPTLERQLEGDVRASDGEYVPILLFANIPASLSLVALGESVTPENRWIPLAAHAAFSVVSNTVAHFYEKNRAEKLKSEITPEETSQSDLESTVEYQDTTYTSKSPSLDLSYLSKSPPI
jgi:hypothetical protein